MVYELDCIADGGAGAALSFTTNAIFRGYLYMVKVIPAAATYPATAFTLVLNDSDGIDVMGGVLSTMSLTLPAQFIPKVGSGYGPRRLDSDLQVVLSGNTQAGALFTLKLYVKPPENLFQ
jgi:hypothetical protein